MTAPKFIEIDGKRHLWRDIVKLRQEQLRAAAEAAPVQPPLFELHEDFRPISRTQRRHPLSRTFAVFLNPKRAARDGSPWSFPPAFSANRS